MVRKLTKEDVNIIYDLEKGNPLYFDKLNEKVTHKAIVESLEITPPNKSIEDKYIIGFFNDKNFLVAICDIIVDYPIRNTIWIGLFMVNKDFQKQHIGSKIITEMLLYLEECGFIKVELGYVKDNLQSEKFWLKNGFAKTEREKQHKNYTLTIAEKILNK